MLKRLKSGLFRHHEFSLRKINELRELLQTLPLTFAFHQAARAARDQEKTDNAAKRQKVLYTEITAGIDLLPLHPFIAPEWDYVCFTGDPRLLALGTFGVWEIRPLAWTESTDSARINRWHKTHPHILFPEYGESLYLDAKIDVRTDALFSRCAQAAAEGAGLRIPVHRDCHCAYREISRNLRKGKETRANANRVRRTLRDAGFPRGYGLTENSILWRKHNNPDVIRLMEEWWDLISDLSHRDQLTLSFVLWRHGISIPEISMPNARHDKTNFYFYRELPSAQQQRTQRISHAPHRQS